MNKKILITGGSGLVGSRLSEKLVEKDFEVLHLSRSNSKSEKYQTFTWDIQRGKIESGAFDGLKGIVHLAGANVAGKKWTPERKKVLESSRIDSANLILSHLNSLKQKPQTFISASAIGIYGFDTGGIPLTEDRIQLGDDFLATLTKKWEAAADQFADLNMRVVKFRIGLVLSANGGLLEKYKPLVNMGLGSALGSGEQYMSWIHIDDLVDMIIEAIENENLTGTYNAVAPKPVTNKEFVRTLAEILGKPYFLPNAPKFVLKLAFGELASVITGGNNASSKKIQDAGFNFQFNKLHESLADIFRK